MKRVIVDYAKLTNEILNLLVDRFPDGYDDSHIIRFRNAKNELIEAVEVRTEDTIYLVKVSTKLATRLENFDEDDIDYVVAPLETIKGIELDVDDALSDDEEEVDLLKDKGGSDDDGDDDGDDDDFADSDSYDEDEDDED